MPSRLNPYLNFDGNAREAMEFYHDVLGGNLVVTTFGEGGIDHDPAEANRIMHAQLEADNGMTLMASDSPPGEPVAGDAKVSVSLSGDDEAELTAFWEKLRQGATVTMPLEKAAWGDQFGMLTDRYGVQWMVNIAGTPRS